MGWTDDIADMLHNRGIGSYRTDNMIQWRNDDCSACRIYERLDRSRYDVIITEVTLDQAVEMTLGRGECRAVSMRERDKRPYLNDEQVCSECGCQLAHEFGDVWQNYCPNCGRKVKQ